MFGLIQKLRHQKPVAAIQKIMEVLGEEFEGLRTHVAKHNAVSGSHIRGAHITFTKRAGIIEITWPRLWPNPHYCMKLEGEVEFPPYDRLLDRYDYVRFTLSYGKPCKKFCHFHSGLHYELKFHRWESNISESRKGFITTQSGKDSKFPEELFEKIREQMEKQSEIKI